MKHDFTLKRRESKNLPPEQLYGILRQIGPKYKADEIYTKYMGFEPPESDEDCTGLDGLRPIKENNDAAQP